MPSSEQSKKAAGTVATTNTGWTGRNKFSRQGKWIPGSLKGKIRTRISRKQLNQVASMLQPQKKTMIVKMMKKLSTSFQSGLTYKGSCLCVTNLSTESSRETQQIINLVMSLRSVSLQKIITYCLPHSSKEERQTIVTTILLSFNYHSKPLNHQIVWNLVCQKSTYNHIREHYPELRQIIRIRSLRPTKTFRIIASANAHHFLVCQVQRAGIKQ